MIGRGLGKDSGEFGGLMAGRREIGFFQRKKEGGFWLSRSLSDSLNWQKVKEEKSGCWFYQGAEELSASGGFKFHGRRGTAAEGRVDWRGDARVNAVEGVSCQGWEG